MGCSNLQQLRVAFSGQPLAAWAVVDEGVAYHWKIFPGRPVKEYRGRGMPAFRRHGRERGGGGAGPIIRYGLVTQKMLS